MWSCGRAARWAAPLLLLLLLLWQCLPTARTYNVDTRHPLLFRGDNGTFFGYSVLLLDHGEERWLVVGAPQASWAANSSVLSPGAIFRCRIGSNPRGRCEQLQLGESAGSVGYRVALQLVLLLNTGFCVLGNPSGEHCGKTCLEERDHQWLGVSLSRQPRENGSFVACGHRWKNVFYIKNEHKLPYGICFAVSSDFRTELSRRICPCYVVSASLEDLVMNSETAYFSSFLMFLSYTQTMCESLEKIMAHARLECLVFTLGFVLKILNISLHFCFAGYSVGAGHFLTSSSTEVIGGAPQQEQTGKAYIFSTDKQINILFELRGKKLGSYFGAAVCAVDLNSDGLSDLLVGAPMESTIREEGRVYVYINSGSEAKMVELDIELSGSDSYAARFGESIANLGDIDNDGFEDVAIGAPQEDDLKGAIYIYNGREDGITPSFSQRIQGQQVSNSLSMFGQSIASGIDADNNGYQDIAVGAFLSDSAVVLRTKPVIIVEASLKHLESVNRTNLNCMENDQPATCMNLEICFTYTGREVPGYVVFKTFMFFIFYFAEMFYNLSVDVKRKVDTQARFYFSANGTSDTTFGSVKINRKKIACKGHPAFMRKDVRDILTPVHVEASYRLGQHILQKRDTQEFSPLHPVLQRRKEKDIIKSKFVFARICSQENCSADLRVSGKVTFPKPHDKKMYLVVGSTKTLLLNVSLHNAGDDAYETVLHIQFPKGLYFIRVPDLEEKQIHCEVLDKDIHAVKLECSVGYLYVDQKSKLDFSFPLDASSFTRADDDLNIIINASCKNEDKNMLLDNMVTVAVPLKYEIELNAHGFVTPASFVYGTKENEASVTCMEESINFTFHVSAFLCSILPHKVISAGPSMAPNVNLELMIPNAFPPHDFKLFNVLDIKVSTCYLIFYYIYMDSMNTRSIAGLSDSYLIVYFYFQTTSGECFYSEYPKNCNAAEKTENILKDVVTFFSKPAKRQLLYCLRLMTYVILESVGVFQIGFFKRQYKPVPQDVNRRDSWSFTSGNKDD
ncbi:UNVERIFIED_CONTAM: hypothetical protein H355_009621 [Colinus virginianus]|nr:hypothetical protein H355_009621 [Colinus virginianus]